MGDMDTEIKEMLRRRADDMRIDPGLPAPVLRRSRRRRGLAAMLAGTTAVLIVAGAVVGAQAILTRTGGPATSPTPPASESPPTGGGTGLAFAGIWPERNADELQAEQSVVDQGNDQYRLDPSQTGVEFAHQALGWDPSIMDARLQVPPGPWLRPIDMVDLRFGTLTREAGLEPHAPYALHVAVQQLGETGDSGIWSVVGVTSDLIDGSCTQPSVPVGGSLPVCGTTSWDPSFASVRAWMTSGDAATTTFDADEASPSAEIAVQQDGSFDGTLGPIPADYGSSAVVVVEVLDQRGSPAGAVVQRIAIQRSEPSPISTVGPLEPQDLPAAVATTREQLYMAAVNHDWDGVKELIGDGFSFSFAEGTASSADQVIDFWMAQPDFHGLDQPDIMARLLTMDPAVERKADGQTIYVWPFAFPMTPDELGQLSEDQRAQLRDVYPDLDQDLQGWIDAGDYMGWRIGVAEDGTWKFFIAGD